ncbi:MAG: DUF1730 domain-containing protein [Clostridiales bacterium]|nr:DUF1730 domain-containing protein [Clostridiales bacterium]
MRAKENIELAMAGTGAARWGCASYDSLAPLMDEKRKERASGLCPSPGGVIVAAFPYYAGRDEGNLSLYARAEDYHKVLVSRLERAASVLSELYPANRFVPLADSSPLPEKAAALLAGIGIAGMNSLIYCDRYGSFVFLGCILTDLTFRNTCSGRSHCTGCLICVRSCPTGALTASGEQVIFEPMRCISAVTQKKGTLTSFEQQALRDGKSAWGCDICQLVCPMNSAVDKTSIDAFSGGSVPILTSLNMEEIEPLSEESFKSLYGDRAFAWRGKAVLERNLRILKE